MPSGPKKRAARRKQAEAQSKTLPKSTDDHSNLSDVLVGDSGLSEVALYVKDEKDIESNGMFVNPSSEYPQGVELNAIEAYAGVEDEVALNGNFFKLLEMVEQIEYLVQGVKGLLTKQKEQM